MDLPGILILTAVTLAAALAAAQSRWRSGLIATLSLLGLYWLQPATTIRHLDFWLPTVSIALVVCTWAATQTRATLLQRQAAVQLGWLLGAILLVALLRYAGPVCCLTPSRPPQIAAVLAGLAALTGAALLFSLPRQQKLLAALLVILLTIAFILVKSESLAAASSAVLRRLSGQDPGLASALDIRWLGYSYLAFRLLSVLRDFQAGKPQSGSPFEFIAYALFFPALASGPIDRLPRFLSDLRQRPGKGAERRQELISGLQRIGWGAFKKFALADTLALFALSPNNAAQVTSATWSWVLLYAYSIRIFLDFSGYTDIAIGLGLILGVRLPENFDRPYTRTNLTVFWNSWHMTLAQWFRNYLFNPLTRWLRGTPRRLPVASIILTGQISTMLLIGLWHGLSWNFAIWGLWHALGLFVHNRWSDWLRPRQVERPLPSRWQQAAGIVGWALTFHYVTLGWVWFTLPTPSAAWQMFLRLFGLAG